MEAYAAASTVTGKVLHRKDVVGAFERRRQSKVLIVRFYSIGMVVIARMIEKKIVLFWAGIMVIVLALFVRMKRSDKDTVVRPRSLRYPHPYTRNVDG